MTPAARALNRFGLGARPDEPAPSDPQRWLLSQLDRYEPLPARLGSHGRARPALVEVWHAMQRAVRQAPEGQRSGIREAYLREAREGVPWRRWARAPPARCRRPTPFVERLVHFWSNHFAVSVDKLLVVGLAGGFEADAIRPHVLGRFEDLLLAVDPASGHAALPGPGAVDRPGQPGRRRRAAERQQRGRGLNENLAREILELHTLGVRSGYTQDDVTEFARALTGWTLAGRRAGDCRRASRSASCPRCTSRARARVLGPQLRRRRRAAGARRSCTTSPRSPATARHVATKLARHFVADDPPAGAGAAPGRHASRAPAATCRASTAS